MGFNLLDLLSGAAPSAARAAQTPPPAAADPGATDVSGVTVQAPSTPRAQITPAPNDGYDTLTPGMGAHSAYNNTPELNTIQDVRNHYPEATHQGSGLINLLHTQGTLRNVLGTLGDAFLVQSGHNPVYAAQNQREQIAQAAAGFENDPGAAADRIAATAAPGSMQEAQNMYTTAQNEQLRKATMQNTQAYRDSIMADRTQNHEFQQQQAQQKTDDRVRQINGGILARAAASGDPKQYAAARAAAVARVTKMQNSGIDPDLEYPTDPKDFLSGYGMNANQVSRADYQQQQLVQHGQIAAQQSADRQRGQNMAQRPAPQMNQTTMLRQLMNKPAAQRTPEEQAFVTRYTAPPKSGGAHLAIPGLGGSTPAATPSFSHTAIGPNGKRMGFNGKQWVPIN